MQMNQGNKQMSSVYSGQSNRLRSQNSSRHDDIVLVETSQIIKSRQRRRGHSDKRKGINEKNVEFCMRDSRKFSMFVRKYKCRICNGVFCSKCVIWSDQNKENLCIDCNEELKDFKNKMREMEVVRGAIEMLKDNKQTQYNKFNNYQDEDDEDLSKNFKKLKTFQQKQGIEATREILAQQSQEFIFPNQHEQAPSSYQKQLLGFGSNKKQGSALKPNSLPINSLSVFEDQNTEQDQQIQKFLFDIQERIMNEFEIDIEKWEEILQKFTHQAIYTVKPWSTMLAKHSIDINEHVKIMLIQHQDTTKCQYVNGVVIKKSIAHKRMKKEIDSPKILVLGKSLGQSKDDADFFDIEQEARQEKEYLQNVFKKINISQPNLIFVRKEANVQAIEQMLKLNITVVTNVKESTIERITRLTQTLSLPNVNFLSKHFNLGTCEKFYVRNLQQSQPMNQEQRFRHSNTDLLFLEGCQPQIGCTILLSGPDLNELKLVKHALKKILRLSRQLLLEKEYYDNLNLFHPQISQSINKSMFLHEKHMERSFLIFKEISFSKRGVRRLEEIEDQTKKFLDAEPDIMNQQRINITNEREVQARVPQICNAATMKRVHFYQGKEQFRDISLGKRLMELVKNCCRKCMRQPIINADGNVDIDNDCQAYEFQHVRQYYHKEGYVECRTRFKEQDKAIEKQNQEAKQAVKDKTTPIFISTYCNLCKRSLLTQQTMTRQMQEFSFYGFLEQFFYNQDLQILVTNEEQNQDKTLGVSCQHSFHKSNKITFLIGPLLIDFIYHNVDIYNLDLICFRDQPGKISIQESKNNFETKKDKLLTDSLDCFKFIILSSQELQIWLSQILQIDQLRTSSFQPARSLIETITKYLELLKESCLEYQEKASKTITNFKADHEFYLNKLQSLISTRILDYVFILRIIYEQIFSEFIVNISVGSKLKDGKKQINKRDQANYLNQLTKQNQYPIYSKQSTDGKVNQGSKSSMINQTTYSGNVIAGPMGALVVQNNEDKLKGPSFEQKNKLLNIYNLNETLENVDQSIDQVQDKTTYPQSLEFSALSQNEQSFQFQRPSQADDLRQTNNNKTLNNSQDIYNSQSSEKSKVDDFLEFEDRLKKHVGLKEMMKMSPSVPLGFDLNCTQINTNDFSTIICQALLSNEHIHGLKQQGYLGLDSRLVKTQQVWKSNYNYVGFQNNQAIQIFISQKNNDGIKTNETDQAEFVGIPQQTLSAAGLIKPTNVNVFEYQEQSDCKPHVLMEEFSVFNKNQDVLNKQISNKEIETELLRIEQINYQINFSTYKDPKLSELKIFKDVQADQKLKVDRPIISSIKVLEEIEQLQPADLDPNFYRDLNIMIIKPINDFKLSREVAKNINQHENQPKKIQQIEKYELQGLWHEKADISVNIFFPSHFQALRKLYCGSFLTQCEQLFKSSYWDDNTGGKSKSAFYKSSDDKYVMKVINAGEMNMFVNFGLSYFEYMNRSFNQKCPSAIGKVLGAFKITIKPQGQKQQSWNLIMMENLTTGIDPQKMCLLKYDLKGSMSRRYVEIKPNSKQNVTKMDTNFLEDRKSMPFVMNYTMNRLLEIAIHNDTSFLMRNKKIDYSLLAWIDTEKKVIRVGIIDYIQSFTLAKQAESQVKSMMGAHLPTILDPKPYKARFKRAMCNYFMAILSDQPCPQLAELIGSKKQEVKEIKS